MSWRIVIEVTAESRERAELFARDLLDCALESTADGDTAGTDSDHAREGEEGFMECGDPGLSHSPQDVDYSIAGEGATAAEALADADREAAE